MATPIWQPGKLYPKGSLVRPSAAIPPNASALDNPNFEAGDTGWDKPAGWNILNQQGFDGNWTAEYSGGGIASIANQARAPVVPGKHIVASAMVAPRHQNNGARVTISWYKADNSPNGFTGGNLITGDIGFAKSTASGSAPPGTAFASVDVSASRGAAPTIYADQVIWNLQDAPVPSGLIYKAVQANTGASGNTEPVWPTTLGVQVIDNQVIWEAVQDSRVVWEASPILVSGATEPVWPTNVGAFVADGTVSWKTVSRRIEDSKCPNSKYVVIAASKVFAGDDDIVPYCATVNPLDWSSPDDAGYLPTGLQLYGANPVKAIGLFRGNVVAWNAQGCQVWQVDEDPAGMALLDAFPIGSAYHKAVAPVSNDLFFLTPLGVRTLGIAGGATNLQAGDIGMPIDPLIQEELKTSGQTPRGLYFPAQGQYWLFFGSKTFVYTMNQLAQVGAWTRYVFPWSVDDYAIAGDDLYLRTGDTILRVDPTAVLDNIDSEGNGDPFDGVVWWPWLDFGAMTVTKQLVGFDIAGSGVASIEMGYDQSNQGTFTPPWTLVADSVPGQLLPFPLAAPSISVRLTFAGGQAWRWDAINLWFQDFRATS